MFLLDNNTVHSDYTYSYWIRLSSLMVLLNLFIIIHSLCSHMHLKRQKIVWTHTFAKYMGRAKKTESSVTVWSHLQVNKLIRTIFITTSSIFWTKQNVHFDKLPIQSKLKSLQLKLNGILKWMRTYHCSEIWWKVMHTESV